MSPCRASIPNGFIKEGERGRGTSTCPTRVWRLFSFPRRGETQHLPLLAGSMRWLLVGPECSRTAITLLCQVASTRGRTSAWCCLFQIKCGIGAGHRFFRWGWKHPLLYLTLDLSIITLTFVIYLILFTHIHLFVRSFVRYCLLKKNLHFHFLLLFKDSKLKWSFKMLVLVLRFLVKLNAIHIL